MGCCKHRGGSRSSPSLPCAGEEEDGDEDDEAEGATGKRAAEDDEVGRAPLVSRVGFGVESVGSEAPGWALGPGSCPCGSCCVPLGDSAQFFMCWFGIPVLWWDGTGVLRPQSQLPEALCCGEHFCCREKAEQEQRDPKSPLFLPLYSVVPSPNGFTFPLRMTTSIPRSRKPTKMTRQQIIIIFFFK